MAHWPQLYQHAAFAEQYAHTEEVSMLNGMGFTESEIFIPTHLVLEHRLKDGQTVSGTAVLNFNKKRGNWGWKALSIEKA